MFRLLNLYHSKIENINDGKYRSQLSKARIKLRLLFAESERNNTIQLKIGFSNNLNLVELLGHLLRAQPTIISHQSEIPIFLRESNKLQQKHHLKPTKQAQRKPNKKKQNANFDTVDNINDDNSE